MRLVANAQTRAEVQRLRRAFLDATEEVSNLQVAQADLWDSKIKDIFAVHLHFLRDRSLRRKISELITQDNYSAEYAVSTVLRDIARRVAETPDTVIGTDLNNFAETSTIALINRHSLTHADETTKSDVSSPPTNGTSGEGTQDQ